ncbi:MAG: hypothetical protein QM478_12440 [Flavobacteriaceae bacterium]
MGRVTIMMIEELNIDKILAKKLLIEHDSVRNAINHYNEQQ